MLPTKFISITRVLTRLSPQVTVKSRVFTPPVINNIRFKYQSSDKRVRGSGVKRKTSSYDNINEQDSSSSDNSLNFNSSDYNIFDDK
jgi:hypothetical protein